MGCKIIICTLIEDAFNEKLLGTTALIEDGVYYFEMPRIDLRKKKDVRIKVAFSDTKEEP